MINTNFLENCLDTIARLPEQFLNCVVTSPPYFNLRDYKLEPTYWPEITFRLNEFTPEIIVPEMTVCLGLESNPVHYIAHLIHIFRLLKPKLKNDGTLWINIGDSYWGSWGNYGGKNRGNGSQRSIEKGSLIHQKGYDGLENFRPATTGKILKAKDLMGVPWMLAFALRADGWYLRQDIIWAKKQAMPESVRDRCTRAHEFIFMLSKQPKYYYDAEAIKTPAKNPQDDLRRKLQANENHKTYPDTLRNGMRKISDKQRGHSRRHAGFNGRWDLMTKEQQQALGANRRSVWHLSTSNSTEKHFAQYNAQLPELMIKAGCPVKGIVYDPFMGSGTTGITAFNLDRYFVGSEMNKEYFDIAERRINTIIENYF